MLAALGQPDRGLIVCIFAYLFGYSGFFFALMSVKSRFLRLCFSFLWMFGVQLHQLSWLGTTTYHGAAIVLVYLWMAAWFAIHLAIVALFIPKTKNITYSRGAAMASLWAIFEVSRIHTFCGFPFNNLGLVLTSSPYSMQVASVAGIFGLSFWVVLCAAWGARFFRDRRVLSGVVWGSVVFIPFLFSLYQIYDHLPKLEKEKQIKVAAVQTGLAVEQKWRFPKDEGTYIEPFDQWKGIYSLMANANQDSFDLIVLPEVALPGPAFNADLPFNAVVEEIIKFDHRLPALSERVAESDPKGRWYVSHAWMGQALANLYKSELVMGLLDQNEDLDEYYNAAFHFVPFRDSVHRYEKRVLVPLAEYLPLPIMKSFLDKYGITDFFTPGRQAKVFMGQTPLSVSICYEEGYSNLMREARLLGAKLFVNVSNDGWFPKSRLTQEHFNLGKVRCVENGVPLVRSCNTGVTAVVDSLGFVRDSMAEVNSRGEINTGIVISSVSSYGYSTLFSYFGNSLIVVISILILLWFFLYRKTLKL